MSKIESLEEFKEVVEYSTLFLLAGTVYSQLPYDKVYEVRKKNRRLGLGLMGIHEWLLKRGYNYGPNDELATWLEQYANSGDYANVWADKHELTRPVKTRAIAPTGTIGIIAETTTGIEPMFCAAYKRRYLADGINWKYEYVVDPTAKRLVEQNGVDPDLIEDAYSLAYNVEKRVEFQAFVQQYVDHAISSTINLPYPITHEEEVEDFKEMLYNYLPNLRGVTCYPNGARGGQPLEPVPYDLASNHEGVVYESEEETCVGGICGI
jgi:ribonucleoside-diphosphate reductase alpha chain